MVALLIVLATLAVVLPVVSALWMRRVFNGRIRRIKAESTHDNRSVLLGSTTRVRDLVVLDDELLVEFEPIPSGARGRYATWATLPYCDDARELIETWRRERTPVRVRYLQQGSEIAAADERIGVTWLSTTAR